MALAEALNERGGCWKVTYDALVSTGLGACVDHKTGGFVLVWMIPEG